MTNKKHYQIFRLDEQDEAVVRENGPEIIENIQKRDAKVWVQQCQRKGYEQIEEILRGWIQQDLEPEEPSGGEKQAWLLSYV